MGQIYFFVHTFDNVKWNNVYSLAACFCVRVYLIHVTSSNIIENPYYVPQLHYSMMKYVIDIYILFVYTCLFNITYNFSSSYRPVLRYGEKRCAQASICARFNRIGTQIIALRRRLPPVLYDTHSSKPVCQVMFITCFILLGLRRNVNC